jgi:serine/threonine protein kinase
MAKVSGPSLTELLARGVTDAQADGFADDIRVLAEALKREGVLHRDLFSDNLLLDADGHLKAIDWQLAIDRARYREDPWVTRNWKFHYVVFGVNRELGLGVWNDFHALAKVLAQLPQTVAVREVLAWLEKEMPEMAFARPPKGWTRFRLWLYGCSLRFQMLLNCRRPEKYARLERRWRTVRCKMSKK